MTKNKQLKTDVTVEEVNELIRDFDNQIVRSDKVFRVKWSKFFSGRQNPTLHIALTKETMKLSSPVCLTNEVFISGTR